MSKAGALGRSWQLTWIDRRRLRGYAIVLWLTSLASCLGAYRAALGPAGSDFLAFWSAGRLAGTGAAARVYDLAATGAVQSALGHHGVFAYVNPPPLLLLLVPFGRLGYPLAWIAWVGLTYLAWLAASLRRDPGLAWPIAAFPGALVSAWHAQTGLLTGALLAGAANLLQRRPLLAGACMGALVIKPHLALLLPVALVAGGYWRAFWAAVGTVVLALALAAAVFGFGVIAHYPDSWRVSRYLIETGGADFYLRQCTVYAAIRLLVSPLAGAIIQALVALAMAAAVWRVWAGQHPLDGKIALLLAAVPLATPYLFAYDLPFLIVPVVWLVQQARTRPDQAWRRPLLLLFYVAPLAARSLAFPLGLNPGPWLELAMVWLVWRDLQAGALSRP